MTRPRVGNVVKLLLWSIALIWLAQQGTAVLADRHYAKHEQRVLDFARRQEVKADSLQEIADSLSNERDSIAVVTQVRTVYVREQIAALPPAVTPSDTLRDAVIALQDSIITDQRKAIDAGLQIEAALRGALAASDERGDSLLAFIQKPKSKPSKMSIGVTAGPCVSEHGTSKLCVTAGVNWKIL
jgi:hypothetical protein